MKTLIAIPCGDYCATDFLRSLLGMEIVGDVQFTFAQGSLIYDARNQLSAIAVDGGFDRVLWLDSDMVFSKDLMRRLSDDMDEGREMISALYFTRRQPVRPVAYTKMYFTEENGIQIPHADTLEEWTKEPFTVAAVGFGAVMMSAALLRTVKERFGLPFSPVYGFGEDLSFCERARQAGAEIWVDPRISVGHIGQALYNESCYKRR